MNKNATKNRTIKNRLQDISHWLINILLAATIVLCVWMTAERLMGYKAPTAFGWTYAVVISGSMEPTIRTGSLIIMKKEPDYKEGAIITYDNGEKLITHRIVEKKGDKIVTQGDANSLPDPIFEKSQIIGRVTAASYPLGEIALYLQNPYGMVLTIATMLALSILTKQEKEKKQQRNKKKEEENHAEIQAG